MQLKNFTLKEHPDWVALRVHSDMNAWMDNIVYVAPENAEEAAQIFSDAMSDWYANEDGSDYRETIMEAAFVNCAFDISVDFCEYDEENDQPLPIWEEKLEELYQNKKIVYDVTAYGYEAVM